MEDIAVGSVYRHTRVKKLYKILGLGHHTETLEEVVVYQGLYDDEKFGHHPVWIRPRVMFEERVEVEGKEVPRFELVEA